MSDLAGVDGFLSCYLDRLISSNEPDYSFALTAWFYLSWRDPRAAAAVEEATAAAKEPGATCARLCNGQKAESAISTCCGAPLWLPSLVMRNVDEFPQGERDQR